MVKPEKMTKVLWIMVWILLFAWQADAAVMVEYWLNSPTGGLDEAINVANTGSPDSTSTLSSMDIPGTDEDDYVARYTGWIVPPQTGNYTFYIASDNDSGLWLSNDESSPTITDTTSTPPACFVTGFVGYRIFTVVVDQQSAPIALQAGEPYAFTIIHRQAGGGDHAELAWKMPGEDDPEVIPERYFAKEYKAGGEFPEDGATDVRSGMLSWIRPALTSGAGTLTYDVYLDADPNFTSPAAATDLSATEFDAGAVDGTNLLFDTIYYWRVDVKDPNIGGTPVTNTGDVWSFTTNDGTPFIVTPPENFSADLNENAIFSVVADTLRPEETLSYQWAFREFGGTSWTDIPGATDATLTLNTLQPEDRGDYRVTVSDSLDNAVQAQATLFLRIGLVHRYSFTDNVFDSVSGAHGNLIVQNAIDYPGVYEDATGTSGNPDKRQLSLENGPTIPSSGGPNCCYVELPDGLISNLGSQATLMVWFTWKTPSETNWMGVFNFNDGTTNYITLTPRSDSRTPRFAYRLDSNNQWYLFSPIPIPQEDRSTTEHCFAITWNEDENRAKLYYNGQEVSSNETTFSWTTDLRDENSWLGRQPVGGDRAFWGAFNEFRIYDIALSPPTVMEAYQLGPDVLPENPCVNQPEMDLDGDCLVRLSDLKLLTEQWLDCGLTTCD